MTSARPTKLRRQHIIVRLLSDNEVSSQEQLVELLGREGIAATQATASRDLEEIGALKVRVPGAEHLIYAVPELPRDQIAPVDHLRRVLGGVGGGDGDPRATSSCCWRTPPGSAHVVASALDRAAASRERSDCCRGRHGAGGGRRAPWWGGAVRAPRAKSQVSPVLTDRGYFTGGSSSRPVRSRKAGTK